MILEQCIVRTVLEEEIIESLIRAISKEIDFYASSNLNDLAYEKNLRLIEAFDKEFKSLKF